MKENLLENPRIKRILSEIDIEDRVFMESLISGLMMAEFEGNCWKIRYKNLEKKTGQKASLDR